MSIDLTKNLSAPAKVAVAFSSWTDASDHLLSIRRQISQSILERLKRGQHAGDVPKAAPIVALAAYYSTVLQGLALQSRDGASRKTLTQVVEFAMADWQQMVSRAG